MLCSFFGQKRATVALPHMIFSSMECASLRNIATDRAPLLGMSDPVQDMNEIPSLIAAGRAVVMVLSRTCFDLSGTVTGLLWRHCPSRNNMPPAHVSLCGSSQKPRRQSAATGIMDGLGLGHLPAIMLVVSLGIVIFAALVLYGARLVFFVNSLMIMVEVQALQRAELP